MQFSPVAIALVVIGVLCVIVGIKGSNKAVFKTLTGHDTTGSTSPMIAQNPMVKPGSGSSAPIGGGAEKGAAVIVA